MRLPSGRVGADEPGAIAGTSRSRDRDAIEDAAEEVVGGQAFGIGLVADDDPVAEDIAGELLTSCGVT